MRNISGTNHERGVMTIRRLSIVLVLVAVLAGCSFGASRAPSPATGLLLNGRQLTPSGAQVALGNFPTGGAVTADGRFLWTVSAGFGSNDVRIVDTSRHRVCQIIPLPGASGGIALDSPHRLAYVSGIPTSRWQPSENTLPGAEGNDILVYSWTATSGQARLLRVIPVPPPPGAPLVQQFPPIPQGSNKPGSTNSWPQKLAVSPDGSRLLVPLNLADSAAVIDLNNSDQVRYVPMGSGSYPFGAAVLPDGRTGLVSNEASGTLSVVDLQSGVKLRDITVGPPLSHPQGIVVDRAGARAYVALSALDEVVVVDLHQWTVERTISVGRSAGLGTMPVALALDPQDDRLFVAESGADEIAVIRLPSRLTRPALNWTLVGAIPTADDPQVVATAAAQGNRAAQLMYVAARGVGVGPNPTGPVPTNPFDPIFWAFNPIAPTTDVLQRFRGHLPSRHGRRPGGADVASLRRAGQATHPRGIASDTAGWRSEGPGRHAAARRRADQARLLRGAREPELRPAAGRRRPRQQRPPPDGVREERDPQPARPGHALPAPGQRLRQLGSLDPGALLDRCGQCPRLRRPQLGPGIRRARATQRLRRVRRDLPGQRLPVQPGRAPAHLLLQLRRGDRGRRADLAGPRPFRRAARRGRARGRQLRPRPWPHARRDLPPSTGSIGSIGEAPDTGEVFDSSLPAGAPAGSYSRIDSFRKRFASQLAAGAVPTFNYLGLTSDHTRGTQPGFPIPSAMVADSDLALGQLVDTISHSKIWSSSAIFVVEDDSQDGADHVDAHRIPVAVISPYARQGAVIHTRYDLLSVVRSMELIMGMKALSLNDALASPMYDAFTSRPLNSAPVDAIPAKVDLLERNTPAAPWAALKPTGTRGDRPGPSSGVRRHPLEIGLWAGEHATTART